MSWLGFVLSLLISSPASQVEVAILEPSAFEPAFGEVVVDVAAYGEPIVQVDLWIDGVSRGSRTHPPWTWTVDLGHENVEHEIRVVARGQSGGEGESSVRTPSFKVDEEVDLDLQQLYVTVLRGGRRALDLGQQDFTIRDEGREQEIVTFARGEVPLTAALLVDASESMSGDRLSAAFGGVRAFVSGLEPLDEASVLLFSDQLLATTPFSSDSSQLLAAIEGVDAQGKTSINDHLYLALQQLEERQGRRVVVLFTDGADLNSVLDMEEVLWKARRSRALVYWLRLEEGGERLFSSSWRDAEGNRRQRVLLEQVVEQSGGRVEALASVSEIESAFRGILRELREQYVLGYYPSRSRNDGSWHDVRVDARGAGLTVRARGGYVDL